MIRNYIKIAWRNVRKNKVFAFINVFGLSVGLACCMLIALYLYHEFSYDRYHSNGDRVFQVGTNFMDDGKEDRRAHNSGALARLMQMDFPEVQTTARVLR